MDLNHDIASKRTSLNPNAKEFVPTSLQPASVDIKHEALHSSSSQHCKDLANDSLSDEESRRYWDSQLPDDILTPDLVAPTFGDRMDILLDGVTSGSKYDKMQLAIDSSRLYPEEAHYNGRWDDRHSLPSHHTQHLGGSDVWGSPVPQNETGLGNSMELGQAFNRHGELAPSRLLAAHDFPALATQTQVDMHCDFHDDMLSKLKLQQDGANWSHTWPSSPNFHTSAPPLHKDVINEMLPLYDFVASQDHELTASLGISAFQRRNTVGDFSLLPPRFSSQSLSSYEERLGLLPHRVFSYNIMENGDISGFHLDTQESQNFMQAQDSYFEKVRSSVKRSHGIDANAKGNRSVKTFYKRGGDIMPQQSSGQPWFVDLHGLHNINEAIALLRQECSVARAFARSSRLRQQIFIFVGSDQQKNARTPRSSKLPLVLAIQRYLVEDEHLTFTEPQPGVIKVVL